MILTLEKLSYPKKLSPVYYSERKVTCQFTPRNPAGKTDNMHCADSVLFPLQPPRQDDRIGPVPRSPDRGPGENRSGRN